MAIKRLCGVWASLALSTIAVAAVADEWITELQRYSAQPNLQHDGRYTPKTEPVPDFRFNDLLRKLPNPATWADLRRSLSESAGAADGVQRARIQAGEWLVTYLMGDRAMVLAQLPEISRETAPNVGYAVDNLRRSLSSGERQSLSLAQQVENFEQLLASLGPIDLNELNRVLGGGEGLQRLDRYLAAIRVAQEKARQIITEHAADGEASGAREKIEALQKEFGEANAADEALLASHWNNPLVARYFLQAVQEEPAEELSSGSTIPDLVMFAGRERADALLRRALELPLKLSLDDRTGDATRQLARERVLEKISILKVPSWGMVQDVDAVAVSIFRGLRKRFLTVGPNDYEFRNASGYFLAALIQQGLIGEAVEFASGQQDPDGLRLPYQALDALERSAQAEHLWTFLHQWLRKDPARSEWDRFNRMSAQLDRRDELKAMVRAMAEDGSFAGLNWLRAQEMQANTELATDDLAEASNRLLVLVEKPVHTVEERESQITLVVKLLRLAHLRKDSDTLAKARAAGEAIFDSTPSDALTERIEAAAQLVRALNSVGDLVNGARIGRLALQHVNEFKQPATDPHSDEGDGSFGVGYTLQGLMAEQLRAEVELENWPEAESLITSGRWWRAKDAKELLTVGVGSNERPVGFYLARVAQHRGDTAQAVRILEAQIVARPGSDSVYESYLDLVGRRGGDLLAKISAVDRYEERPLIWRARMELDENDFAAATLTLQQAIGIDPSDGEQGAGDRMRVYAYMSEAMAANRDAEKATFFANVVKSIRLSETADRWFEIGAYARAIALYREALGFFDDAYCIQSRLAVRLAGEGRIDEAAEHYSRAFQLMPDSFGRVESHCFGCEHVFAGEKSQSLAEEVFTQMLQARPDKPQVHYLMGYLREEQQRLPEAAEHYRKSVELDPLYLNAWSRLSGLQQKLSFTATQRDDLLLKLIELDPTRRHSSPDLSEVSDFARLWQALAESTRAISTLPAPEALWELTASAAELASRKAQPEAYGNSSGADFFGVLLEHEFILAIQTYLAVLNNPSSEN